MSFKKFREWLDQRLGEATAGAPAAPDAGASQNQVNQQVAKGLEATKTDPRKLVKGGKASADAAVDVTTAALKNTSTAKKPTVADIVDTLPEAPDGAPAKMKKK